ncbi:hypothetical protein [Solimonas sp. K1W22B-7]|uniref:hypothetical protein n=1 Tax=Solimonas sp. K1W22B-7 TaxID=2303331 RepID=UPI0013C4C1B5|nr:hypothetical protein [Solimonas sp. K1W22B-7]
MRSFQAKPRRDYLKEGPGWYSYFGVAVSSGRLAMISKWDVYHAVEIELELVQEQFFFEADLKDILSVLQVDWIETKRVQGGFTWK